MLYKTRLLQKVFPFHTEQRETLIEEWIQKQWGQRAIHGFWPVNVIANVTVIFLLSD
jgi:hypothetical protein